ncbi:MAG: bifunctional (p)ppGpp synthetase/guanosine-3',5'-bis(diphosphate) 3'-pyrophosphohydrolase [Candidatus Niyogibacteria bacterium]|nr:bifunctional (p)ppGpp synthetase/guanosine-3',5'-bis(diphosphate) 3'-pyrophosphohydrolase [Candidatus Niyogibacteria bacterium]
MSDLANLAPQTLLDWEAYRRELDRIAEHRYSSVEYELIRRAFDYAADIHREQLRFSGDPYLTHPIAVSLTAAAYTLDAPTIAAALIHDTVEDGGSLADVRKRFGDEVAQLVDGVTKVDKIHYHGAERAAESMRRMFFAVAEDVRVIILKLVDRLHNMQTLWAHPAPEKRLRIATETLDIYAPIADRLGMGELKGELEDLAFAYVHPDEHRWVSREIRKRIPEREDHLKKVQPLLERALHDEGIPVVAISARAKRFYSAWKKVSRYDMNWDHVLDLVALRVVVPEIEHCYAALGAIHALWPPMPGRIKDYIALPKPNGYQSLHTTVFCEGGNATEFQIRTETMQRESEYGITAHWLWSETEKPKTGTRLVGKKFAWVNQLKAWQEKIGAAQSSEDYLESLKIDFFRDRIFVLTPKGDVVDLPENATPVDFAYHIHSEIGDHAVGAKVNSKMVSLDHPLSSGDMVEMLTQKNKRPSAEWLAFAKTALARSQIRHALKSAAPVESPVRATEFEITVDDRVGILKDISGAIARFRINIETASAERRASVYSTILIRFQQKRPDQIEKIKTQIKKIRGVRSIVERVKPAKS